MKTMKFFAAMCCAVMMFAFTGCSKDLEDEIIGSWSLVSETVIETYNGQSHTETEYPEEGDSTIITFNEDNTYTEVVIYDGNDFTTTGTYSINGDKLTINPEDDEPSTGTLEIDGKNMTLTYSESYGNMSIKAVGKFKKI